MKHLIVFFAQSSTNNIIQFFRYGSQTITFFCFERIFQVIYRETNNLKQGEGDRRI